MSRQARLFAIGVVVVGVFLACVVAFGCAAMPSPSDQAAVAAYEAEQLACELEAGTLLDAHRCRCAVHMRYGRPCVWVTLDGGRE